MAKDDLTPAEETQDGTTPEGQEKSPEGKELQSRNEPEDFQTLYRESLKTMEEGQILNGTVIDITPDHVTVDIGYKREGQIPIREFQRRDKKIEVKIGDRIEVYLEKKESEEGYLLLSKEKADKVTIWRDIGRSYREGEVIEGEIVSKVKGGRSVEIGGVIGFLPGSQIDLKPIRNLDEFIGKRCQFKVIKLNRKRQHVVLSRR